jgi:hypothetical protein
VYIDVDSVMVVSRPACFKVNIAPGSSESKPHPTSRIKIIQTSKFPHITLSVQDPETRSLKMSVNSWKIYTVSF